MGHRGELPAGTDVERLIDLTSGYLFMRRIGRWNPVPPADVPDVVRFLLIAAGWRDPMSSHTITSKETPHA